MFANKTKTSRLTYALIGNPNCGKTTIFNALTGLRQKVGNYPGVTVERKEGICTSPRGESIRIIDLPGAYSLNARSPDEAVLRDVLLGRRADTPRPDRILCVLDASNLERHLYFASQVLELGLPTILILNMVDVAEESGLRIEFESIAKLLGCIVLPMQANVKKGLVELKFAMGKERLDKPNQIDLSLAIEIQSELEAGHQWLMSHGVLSENARRTESLYLLSQHDPSHHGIPDHQLPLIQKARDDFESRVPAWEDRIVSARYDWIHRNCHPLIRRPGTAKASLTDRLDHYFLHPIFGWAVLIFILGILFCLIFSIAEGPMHWIENGFGTMSKIIENNFPKGDLRDLITKGVIAGVKGVMIFLPQILILFFFIGLMEDTGYMARVAFIMDRLMSRVGLNGKSFLPLLSSYACAVPAIMATRTIDSPKDRLITILIVPLASCSARLPVYLLMIATMIPSEQIPVTTKAGMMIFMYFLGTAGAFVFAWIFNRTLMKGEGSPMILELPAYKVPSIRGILMQLWERTRLFIRRAGTIILGISILLWVAASYPKSDSADPAVRLSQSAAGKIGKIIEPIIEPLGYDWKIGIGLIASFAAREIFVSTMSIIYSVEENGENLRPLRDRLAAERRPDGTPRYTPLVCLSLMVFYVFAMQCMSTIAIVKRETNGWKWPLFQLGYMSCTAYLAALLVYQIGSLLGY